MDPQFAIKNENQIVKVCDKASTLQEMVSTIVGRGFRVCNWGSCQYSYVQDVYELLLRVQSIKKFTIDEMLDFLRSKKMDISQQNLTPVKYPLHSAKISLINTEFDPDTLEEFMEDFDQFLKDVSELKKIDDLFVVANYRANHLYSAVNVIFDAIYPHNSLGKYEAIDIACKCWILTANNLISSDECLRNFDT